jgi:hypothetical protein
MRTRSTSTTNPAHDHTIQTAFEKATHPKETHRVPAKLPPRVRLHQTYGHEQTLFQWRANGGRSPPALHDSVTQHKTTQHQANAHIQQRAGRCQHSRGGAPPTTHTCIIPARDSSCARQHARCVIAAEPCAALQLQEPSLGTAQDSREVAGRRIFLRPFAAMRRAMMRPHADAPV